MQIQLSCQACHSAFTLQDEPRLLLSLCCPQCGAAAPRAPAEDLASSLEDTLSQLHALSGTFRVTLSVDSAALPAAFRPDP
jgi:hypothetical protein